MGLIEEIKNNLAQNYQKGVAEGGIPNNTLAQQAVDQAAQQEDTTPTPTNSKQPQIVQYTATRKITLAAYNGTPVTIPIFNVGGGSQLDVTVYLTNTAELPGVQGTQTNTVLMNFIDWRPASQFSNFSLSTDSSVMSVKNRQLQQLTATNYFTQAVTIVVIYTVKSNDDSLPPEIGNIQEIIGSVNLLNIPTEVSQAQLADFAAVGGTLPAAAIPITFTNNQNTSTFAFFNQLLTINSSLYNAYEDADLDNINFQDGNGNIIPSWLESGETNNSISTNYWLLLTNGISPGASVTVYMCFYPLTTFVKNNNNTGTEPTWAGGTYGQYDNGASMFPLYDNFAGAVLNAGIWATTALTNMTVTVSNKLIFTASSDAATAGGIVSVATLDFSQITEINILTFSNTGITGALPIFYFSQTTSNVYGTSSFKDGYTFSYAITQGLKIDSLNSLGVSTPLIATDTFANSITPFFMGFGWDLNGPGSQYGLINYTNTYFSNPALTYSANDSSIAFGDFYVGITVNGSTHGISFTAQWVRSRSPLPNGVMPSATLGSIESTTLIENVGPWNINIATIAGQKRYTSELVISAKGSNTITATSGWIKTIVILATNAGTAWTLTVQDGSATPVVLVNAYSIAATTNPVILLNLTEPILMNGGIYITTAGTTAGSLNIWITYYQ